MCAVFHNPYEILCELCGTICISQTALKEQRQILDFKNLMIRIYKCMLSMKSTALYRGSYKYLTAQDTHITPTLKKHHTTSARLDKLLSLQPRSVIQINRALYA